MSTAAPTLAADLTAGLKRLKMAGMRRLAPELLVTAKTQRWNPEEFLRTLVEAEIAARDESNARTRRRQACFPVSKTLDEFDLTPLQSRGPPSTTSAASNGSEQLRMSASSGQPGPAKAICFSRSDRPPSTPDTESATTAPPTWSTPSTAVWLITAWAR
jgi:hypothetical protein